MKMELAVTCFAITLDFQTGVYTYCSLDTQPFVVEEYLCDCLQAGVGKCSDKSWGNLSSKMKLSSCFSWELKELLGERHAYLKFKACLIHEESGENLSKLIYGTEENPGRGKKNTLDK